MLPRSLGFALGLALVFPSAIVAHAQVVDSSAAGAAGEPSPPSENATTTDAAPIVPAAAPIPAPPATQLAVPASSAPAADPPGVLHASFADGVTMESADGRFGFRIGAVIQYRAQLNQMVPNPPDVPNGHGWHGYFNSFYVRPQLRLHAFGQQLKVFVQPEFSGASARLLDLEITYQPHEAFAIKAGQFMTPYSRFWLTPIPVQQFVDFGVPNDVFRWGRDTGVMVYGTPLHGKLEYYLGAFNGNGINQPEFNHVHGMGVARLVASPLGAVPYDQTVFLNGRQPFRFAIGIDGYWNRITPYSTTTNTVSGGDRVYKAAAMDFAITVDRFSFLTEAYYRNVTVFGPVPSFVQWGFEAQAGYFIAKARLEIAARATYANLDRAVSNDDITTWEGALHYYIYGNHAKLQLRYQYAVAGSNFNSNVAAPGMPSPGNAPAWTGLSIASYYPGTQHRLMLQAQIFF